MPPLSIADDLRRLSASRSSFDELSPDDHVPVPVAAQLTGYGSGTLQVYRTLGVLPAATPRYQRPILYRVADLAAHVSKRRGS